MYMRESESAQTVILTPKQADDLRSPPARDRASDFQPRRSATPRANPNVRALNLANVDNYVGRITLIQAGANNSRSKKRRNFKAQATKSFKITPANITDELLLCKDDTEALRMSCRAPSDTEAQANK